MVIVIMGEAQSGRDAVCKVLAESLGWEFAEVGYLQSGSLAENEQYRSQIEKLSAVIRTSTYEWTDVVVSCSTLTGTDQKRLRIKGSNVEFVHLQTADGIDQSRLSDPSKTIESFRGPNDRNVTVWPHDAVLTVDYSNQIDQVCSAIVSQVILHQKSA